MATIRTTKTKLFALLAGFAVTLPVSAAALGSNSSELQGTEIPGLSEALAQLEAEAVLLTEGVAQDKEMECWAEVDSDWDKPSLQGSVLGACGPFNTPEAKGQFLVDHFALAQGEDATGAPVIRLATLSPSKGIIAQPFDSVLDAAAAVWKHLERDVEGA